MEEQDVRFVMWDYRDHPDSKQLGEAAQAGYIHFIYVDTGSDQIALCASRNPITETEAQSLWDESDG